MDEPELDERIRIHYGSDAVQLKDNGGQMSHPSNTKQIEKALDNIFDTYGFFLGVGYTDKNGNLAIHKKGKVKEEILKLLHQSNLEAEITQTIKDAIKAGNVEMPNPNLYGNDWRLVTLRLDNIHVIPLWREFVALHKDKEQ